MQGLANLFYNQGCNVISGLLPGHWRKDSKAFYKMNDENWINAHQQWLELAKPLGKNLIVVGHSLGGLLSFRAALLHPEIISAAVLLAPALQLNSNLSRKIYFGNFLNLDLNQFSNQLNPFYRTEKPVRVGSYVEHLIKSTFKLVNPQKQIDRSLTYQLYKVPSFIISTEDDDVVSDVAIKNFYDFISSAKKGLFYAKNSGVFHDNIQRSTMDLLESDPVFWSNPHFDEQSAEIIQFLLPYLK